MDLADSDGVKETLDNTEDGAEAPGGVDDVELTQALGVVVLGDLGGLTDVAVDGGDAGNTDTLHIHDCAAGLEELAGLARAGGETGVGHLLILGDEVLQHTLAGGDLVHLVEVDLAQLLNVKGTAILVSLVVVLRVELENLGLLWVFESGRQIISAEFLAPLLSVDEHLLSQFNIKLASAQESKQGQSIQAFGVALLLEHCPQLVHLGILFRSGVAGVTRDSVRRGSREVVLIVLGIGG